MTGKTEKRLEEALPPILRQLLLSPDPLVFRSVLHFDVLVSAERIVAVNISPVYGEGPRIKRQAGQAAKPESPLSLPCQRSIDGYCSHNP